VHEEKVFNKDDDALYKETVPIQKKSVVSPIVFPMDPKNVTMLPQDDAKCKKIVKPTGLTKNKTSVDEALFTKHARRHPFESLQAIIHKIDVREI